MTFNGQVSLSLNISQVFEKSWFDTKATCHIVYKYSIFSDNISFIFFAILPGVYVLSIYYLTLLPSYDIRYNMTDEKFFLYPKLDWQRRYEALRASFVDRLPAKVVADRFNYSTEYIHLLRHQFRHGKIDFSEPVPEGKVKRRTVNSGTREKVKFWRERRLSAGEIAELLSEEGVEISVRTVERVIAEEGFPKLPRRTRLKTGFTVKGTELPRRSSVISIGKVEGSVFDTDSAGIFLFAPFLAKLGIEEIVQAAGLPGTKAIPAKSYFLSFLALKLLGTERYAHVGDHAFDPALGLFAGLNVLPKCTAMSAYSYSLDDVHILHLQNAFVRNAARHGLYDGKCINLDFHTVPHYGDESVLEEHWAGARNKRMKGALTLFAQDGESKLILYTDADIRRSDSDDQVLQFLSFWKSIRRGVKPTLVFDSKFTSYTKLSELDANHSIKFITLRRRGKNLIKDVEKLSPWKRIEIPHAKRKYKNPQVHDSTINLRDYEGEIRQIVVRGNGRDNPAFLITNDFDMPAELVVGNYARRWRVENGIAEAVKFFHLNALSSPILVKVHFDVAMTMIADTLYCMLAKKLRGFEDCDAPKLYRHFVRGKGSVSVKNRIVTVTYPRRAHNPILRKAAWDQLPAVIPGMEDTKLQLRFK
ncbi:transposase DDE domain protein [bacterium BMS3Bbin05]|nr:transposase DDE domain protein [bacterium BMS3Bbin05]